MTLLPIIALITAALFTGAAGYITFVEHPARLQLTDGPLLAQWQPSYAKALPIQSILAIIGGASGLGAGYFLGDWLWLAGGVAMLANWPFTLTAIMPTNSRLNAIHPENPLPETRALLIKWGRLHSVRTGLGAIATLLYAIALASALVV